MSAVGMFNPTPTLWGNISAYQKNLTPWLDLPIVPLKDGGLLKLNHSGKCLFQQANDFIFPANAQSWLQRLGVIIVPNGYLPVHQLSSFIKLPSSATLLSTLMRFSVEEVRKSIVPFGVSDKSTLSWLVGQLARISAHELAASASFLKQLPFFQTAPGTKSSVGSLVSAEEAKHVAICAEHGFTQLIANVGFSGPLIVIGELTERTFGSHLKVQTQTYKQAVTDLLVYMKTIPSNLPNFSAMFQYIIHHQPVISTASIDTSVIDSNLLISFLQKVTSATNVSQSVSKAYYNAFSLLPSSLAKCPLSDHDAVIFRCSSGEFHAISTVAQSLPDGCQSFCPYFCAIDQHLCVIPKLCERLGVPPVFSTPQIILTLQNIAVETGNKPLPCDKLRKYLSIVTVLKRALEESPESQSVPLIALPNVKSILRSTSDLVYSGTTSSKFAYGNVPFCHPEITLSLASFFGLDTKASKDLAASVDETFEGCDFGQTVELIPRIKGIIDEYSSSFDVFYEFIQNADDAGASKIVFVYDCRQHGTENVLKDTWAELQGHAMLVYNNAVFSQADFDGICRVGVGSKQDEPSKIGRYGAGFNVCYKYTDCPSFISDNQSFCVLDPFRRYLPNLPPERLPGRRWKNISQGFAVTVSDIYESFLIEDLPLVGATMFRLPLRKKGSTISVNCFTASEFQKIAASFNNDSSGLESLLFVRNITELSLIIINQDDTIANLCHIATVKSHVDGMTYDHFTSYVMICCSEKTPMSEIERCYTTYEVKAKTCQYTDPSSSWLVTEYFGFQQLPAGIDLDKNEQNMFPLAGVACSLNPNSVSKRRVFCALPLKERTGLPVHINGMFALDFEGRNSVYVSSENDLRHRWNQALISDVLVSAYLQLLLVCRGGKSYAIKEAASKPRSADGLSIYYAMFPRRLLTDTKWQPFVSRIYVDMITLGLPLFEKYTTTPSWISAISNNPKTNPTLFVTRKSFTSQPLNRSTFFSLLNGLGINVILGAWDIHAEICSAGVVNVECVDRSRIASFLQANSNRILNKSESVPVEKSLFGNASNVSLMINFLYASNDDTIDIEGVPLLITADVHLRPFSAHRPVFSTRFPNIINVLPKHLHKFGAADFLKILPLGATGRNMLRKLDIVSLATMVRETISGSLCSGQRIQVSDLNSATFVPQLIDQEWIHEIWTLIADASGSGDVSSIASIAIIPAIQQLTGETKMWLYPVAKMGEVLTAPPGTDIPHFLLNMGAPILQQPVRLPGGYLGGFGNHASPQKLIAVLTALTQSDELCVSKVDAEALLGHLTTMVNQLDSHCLNALKFMPIFESFCGQMIAIGTRPACSIVEVGGIPMQESDVWLLHGDKIVLRANTIFKSLFKALGIIPLYVSDLYRHLIIPCLPQLSRTCQVDHLFFILTNFYHRRTRANEASNMIHEELKAVAFILTDNGSRKKIGDFLDPNVDLFRLMEPDNVSGFLPSDFVAELRARCPEQRLLPNDTRTVPSFWISFLHSLGLKNYVKADDIVRYAKMLETADLSSEEAFGTFQDKSKAVFDALAVQVSNANLCCQIKDVAFLLAGSPCVERSSIAEPMSVKGHRIPLAGSYGIENVDLVWTVASILPEYTLTTLRGTAEASKNELGLRSEPPVSLVVQHVVKIFQNSKKQESVIFGRICHRIYQYLQTNMGILNDSLYKILSKMSLVFIPSVKRCLRADMVYMDGSSHSEVFSVIHRIPEEFRPFQRLFSRIGLTSSPQIQQYVTALSMMFTKSSANKLEGVERHIAERLQFCLLMCKKPNWDSIKELYLLGSNERLNPSQNLIYVDTHVADRDNLMQERIVWLDPTGSDSRIIDSKSNTDLVSAIRSFLRSVPEHLRPQRLSERLVKRIDEDMSQVCHALESTCEIKRKLEENLQSQAFVKGYDRVLAQYGEETEAASSIKQIESFVANVKVKCYEELRSQDIYDGQVMENSSKSVDCFVSERDQLIVLHLRHLPESENLLYFKLALGISKTGFLPELKKGPGLMILEKMLMCASPGDIESVLNSLDVQRREPTSTSVECSDLVPGDELPDSLIPYLDRSLDKPLAELDRVAVYMATSGDAEEFLYGEILAEMTPETGAVERQYRVRLGAGAEPIVASAVDVFGFLDDDSGVEDGEETVPISETYVAAQLECIQQFSQTTRLRALRRFYMSCQQRRSRSSSRGMQPQFQEVFSQYISRIQTTELTSMEQSVATSWKNVDPVRWANCLPRRPNRAQLYIGHRQSQSQRITYQISRSSTVYYQPSYVPDPENAERWRKQAMADMTAARVPTTGNPFGFEHVILLCQQAVEKAYKAVMLKKCGQKDGTHDLLTLNHRISRFTEFPTDLTGMVTKLVNECHTCINMARYPDFHTPPDIPNTAYSAEMASKAQGLTENILQRITSSFFP